jgi:hypothetical protein
MAVTWQNIAPTNGASILEAMGQGNKMLSSGISGIGDAVERYRSDRSDRETNELTAAMALIADDGSVEDIKRAKEDRNALLQSIDPNTSFANLDTVIEAYKTANAPVDPSWSAQEKIKHDYRISEIIAENKAKNSGKTSKDYLNQYRADMIKQNKEAGTTSNWSLGIADVPADEVIDKLSGFFKDNNYTMAEQNRAIKIFKQAFTFDESGIDEFIYGGKDVEELENVDLMDILKLGKFQTDAFIESEKEKKKQLNK